MVRKKKLVLGSAASLAAILLVGAGGCLAIAVAEPASHAVNPPVAAAPGAPESFADIVAKVAPAVVSIDVVQKAQPSPVQLNGAAPFPFPMPNQGNQPFGFSFKWVSPQQGGQAPPTHASGSGFFISPEGYIVTNDHVVGDAEKITVHTSDSHTYPATVIGRDPATDLAVIKVSGGPFPYVSFENRGSPRVGDWVVAVGNPFGLGGTATAGIVSALGRENVSGSAFVNYMQIDAPINHGNSGGPTFDVEGRVVGVNTAIFTPSGGSVGIGFDIPADVAASVTKQLIADGKVTRGYIGATVQSLSPDLASSLGLPAAKGAIVDQLSPGGPAQQAGLRTGDVILAADGKSVDDASALTRQVALAHPGDDITLAVVRDGERRLIQVRSGLRPSEVSLASNTGPSPGNPGAGPAVLGMQVAPDPNGGLVVEQVAPDSAAADSGLQSGDVILRAGDQHVASTADLSRAAAGARDAGRRNLPLLVARGGQRMYVPIGITAQAG
ncbi:MAG TPA: Do family serine endopeptidase [Caulobacteraceae bacterium]|nr:Do family serine endopeptidase [Caulobacteraceae bacterium]